MTSRPVEGATWVDEVAMKEAEKGTLQGMDWDAPQDDWVWPEEQTLSSYYVRNRTVPGEAPAPKPVPKPIPPRGPTTDGAGQNSGVQVREYSWSDDIETIKVYVPIPGVVRDKVKVDIQETAFFVVAETDGFGTYRLNIRKLFAPVNVALSSFKVLERKEKVIITLRKFDPPGYGDNEWVAHKQWAVLHYATTGNTNALTHWEDAAMYRKQQLAAGPEMPKMPANNGRRKE